jgi:hypothetical protein
MCEPVLHGVDLVVELVDAEAFIVVFACADAPSLLDLLDVVVAHHRLASQHQQSEARLAHLAPPDIHVHAVGREERERIRDHRITRGRAKRVAES